MTFRDTRKLNSFSFFLQEEAKIGFGLLKKIELEKKQLDFLVSTKLFSIYHFNRINAFESALLTLEDEFIASSSRTISSVPEFDLGVEFNLDIIYEFSNKFGLGLSIRAPLLTVS